MNPSMMFAVFAAALALCIFASDKKLMAVSFDAPPPGPIRRVNYL